MPAIEPWIARGRTVRAMALLLCARILVALVPFRFWRGRLGLKADNARQADVSAARKRAAQIERAALRLPLETKCLPRAMALSWLLRRSGNPHRFVVAARPPNLRGSGDDLHAWVELGGAVVMGDLPGPWLTMLDQGG